MLKVFGISSFCDARSHVSTWHFVGIRWPKHVRGDIGVWRAHCSKIRLADFFLRVNFFLAQLVRSGCMPTTITTRLHNGMLPSPTLRMERGARYIVTVSNQLGPEAPNNPTGMNGVKDPNTTNIHTHGPHLSGTAPADDVFSKILPGKSGQFLYNVPCDHAGGTFWCMQK